MKRILFLGLLGVATLGAVSSNVMSMEDSQTNLGKEDEGAHSITFRLYGGGDSTKYQDYSNEVFLDYSCNGNELAEDKRADNLKIIKDVVEALRKKNLEISLNIILDFHPDFQTFGQKKQKIISKKEWEEWKNRKPKELKDLESLKELKINSLVVNFIKLDSEFLSTLGEMNVDKMTFCNALQTPLDQELLGKWREEIDKKDAPAIEKRREMCGLLLEMKQRDKEFSECIENLYGELIPEDIFSVLDESLINKNSNKISQLKAQQRLNENEWKTKGQEITEFDKEVKKALEAESTFEQFKRSFVKSPASALKNHLRELFKKNPKFQSLEIKGLIEVGSPEHSTAFFFSRSFQVKGPESFEEIFRSANQSYKLSIPFCWEEPMEAVWGNELYKKISPEGFYEHSFENGTLTFQFDSKLGFEGYYNPTLIEFKIK